VEAPLRLSQIPKGSSNLFKRACRWLLDNSQKQLLNKLGNLAHKNGYSSENSSKRLGEYAKI